MWLFYLTKFKWVIAAVSLFAGVFTITNYFEQKGYNRAIVELQGKANEAVKEATDKAITKAQKDMQKALDAQQETFDNELERVANEKKVEIVVKEIYRNVDKIIIKDECNTVNDDVIRVLNDSINNSNAASNKD